MKRSNELEQHQQFDKRLCASWVYLQCAGRQLFLGTIEVSGLLLMIRECAIIYCIF